MNDKDIYKKKLIIMKNFIKNFIKDLVNSLNTQPTGFSARKLTAIVTMMCVIFLHIKYIDKTNVLSALEYDMMFVSLLFGIVTFDQLYKFKSGRTPTEEKPKEEIKQEPVKEEIKN